MAIANAVKFRESFRGDKAQCVEEVFSKSVLFCEINNLDQTYKSRNIGLCLTGGAVFLYERLPVDVKDDYQQLKNQMIEFFGTQKLPSDVTYERLNSLTLENFENMQLFYESIIVQSCHPTVADEQKTGNPD